MRPVLFLSRSWFGSASWAELPFLTDETPVDLKMIGLDLLWRTGRRIVRSAGLQD